jgi:peptidoglycan/LPS O-acetylase OafA/YrhL
VTLVTGMLLFVAEPSRFLANPFFVAKMIALVLAGMNLLVFHAGVYSRVSEWDDARTPPLAARLSAVLSLTAVGDRPDRRPPRRASNWFG